MKKRFLILMAFTLLAVTTAGAQGPADWSAWLYESVNGHMVRVDASGAVLADFTLPTVMGHRDYPERVAVSHNGNLIAYTVHNPDMNVSQFLVYDTVSGNWVLTYSPGSNVRDGMAYAPGEALFDAFDTSVIYAYDSAGNPWTMAVLDLSQGLEIARLTGTDPAITSTGIISPIDLPVVQHYSGTEVDFTMEGNPDGEPLSSWSWNIVTGQVRPNNGYPALNVDTFWPTGESVMALMDERFPIRALASSVQFNALQVYDSQTGERFPFFVDSSSSMLAPHIVQNGQRVLVQSTNLDSGASQWLLLGRDGSLVGAVPMSPDSVYSIAGVADGLIYTNAASTPSGTVSILVHINVAESLTTSSQVWTGEPGHSYQIVWAHDDREMFATRDSLPPWVQLAAAQTAADAPTPFVVPTVNAPPPTVEVAILPTPTSPAAVAPSDLPTSTPLIPSATLHVGGQAFIRTTSGDRLNIRGGPGVSFGIVARVETGTRVTLLEGPRNGEGFTWWRVRLPDGTEGWAVESVEDNGLRLYTLVPY